MQAAIQSAGIRPTQIDYVNAHATSTPLGDVNETQGIKLVFGDHARKLAVSATKSMTGHLIGASGALEALIIAKTLETGIITPTINLDDPDPTATSTTCRTRRGGRTCASRSRTRLASGAPTRRSS